MMVSCEVMVGKLHLETGLLAVNEESLSRVP